MQEIYNRYFFFRKEEVHNPEQRDARSMRFSPRKTRNNGMFARESLARSMINFEDLKSRDSLKKFSKESMVSSPLDHHQRSKMMVDDQGGVPSVYSIHGRNDRHITSVDNVTNLKSGFIS